MPALRSLKLALTGRFCPIRKSFATGKPILSYKRRSDQPPPNVLFVAQ